MWKKCIIYISNSNYIVECAGTEKFLKELIIAQKKIGIHSVHLFPIKSINERINNFRFIKDITYFGCNIDGRFIGIYREKKLSSVLKIIAEKNRFVYQGLIINQIRGWNLNEISNVISELELKVKLIVHDYLYICSKLFDDLGKGDICGKYLDAPSDEKCKECVYKKTGIKNYTEFSNFLFENRNSIIDIIVPSDSVKNNWMRLFENTKSKIIVRPHLTYNLTKNHHYIGKKINIGFLGLASGHKGFDKYIYLKSMLKDDNYNFFYLGRDTLKAINNNLIPVLVDSGCSGSIDMISALRTNEIDVAFLWSQCQETYSYTYYEAFAAGCFIITNKYSGNIATAVSRDSSGKVYSTIDECANDFKALESIRNNLENYYNYSLIPQELKPNGDINDLSFKEKNDNSFEESVNVKKNSILTVYYKIKNKI